MAKKNMSPRHNKRNDLTAEYIRSILDYDPETGIFIWKFRNNSPHFNSIIHFGKRAGCETCGYRRIKINKKVYSEHRIAWLHFYGVWPNEIDHINTNGADNKIKNLREATSAQNNANRRVHKNNRSGFKGVGYYPRYKEKKFRACIQHHGKEIYLGYFKSAEEAHAAYCDASKKYHGDFGRIE